jgi:hypothetical protein
MAEKQSYADAFSGFLAPERVAGNPMQQSVPAKVMPALDADEEAVEKILAVLGDGKPHAATAVRTASKVPLLRFAQAVAALQSLGMVEVVESGDKELLALTPRGKTMAS